MSFRYKFVYAFILIEAALLILLVLFNTHMLTRQSQQLIEQKLSITNDLFAEGIRSSLLSNDLESLEDSILSIASLTDILCVQVVDEHQQVLSQASNPAIADGEAVLEHLKKQLNIVPTDDAKHGSYVHAEIKVGDKKVLVVEQSIKLDYSDFELATLRYAYDQSSSHAILENARKVSFLLITVGLVISVLIATMLGFKITNALNRLTQAARNIASDKPASIPNHRHEKDEISQLSNAMLHMQQQITEHTYQLKQARKQALMSSKAKSEFLALMSHEIRTPLNGMIGSLNLIHIDRLSKDDAQCIEMVKHSSDILITVINDILDFSKIEAGKFSLDQHAIDLNGLLKSIEDFYRPLVENKGLAFYIQRTGLDDVYIKGDEIRIKQIINNFLNNAIKFTEKGSITLTATFTANKALRFDVTDTGIGIHKDDIQHLFTDFAQLNVGNNRQYGGTGLGLAISKRLANLMNGETFADSQYGKGSTFSVELRLPFMSKQAYQEQNAQLNDQQEQLGKDLSAKVLLVEDNRTNQIIAKRLLEKIGCDVTIANNGVESIERLQNGDFDIVLMDCQMPVMDGFEATMHIRQSGNTLPIIALTANAQDTDKQACFRAGMSDFVSKPFKPGLLYQKIQKHLRSPHNDEEESPR